MAIEHLLAVIPVSDVESAGEWYHRLLGREPDNRPMDSLAGSALLNFAVDDLPAHLDGLRARGWHRATSRRSPRACSSPASPTLTATP